MGSPIPSSSDNFWINPCGVEVVDEEDSSHSMPMDEIFNGLLMNSQVSFQQATKLKEYLLANSAGLDEDSLMDHSYDWLQLPPTDLTEYFTTLDRDTAVKDAFHLMQKFAVALDQMIKDQVDESEYFELLNFNKEGLIQLLCSLQFSLFSFHVQPPPDATTDIMGEELRNLSTSAKLIRDFLVARDYVKATHYITQLTEYVLNKN